jgi:hypothetical protein
MVLWTSHIDTREVNDTDLWDVRFNATTVIFARETTWDDLRITVRAVDETRFNDVTPERYPPYPSPGEMARVYYVDSYGDTTMPDVGDRIWLMGLDRSHQGMDILVRDAQGHDLWGGRLPVLWQELVSVELLTPAVRIQDPVARSWTVSAVVGRVTPPDSIIPWDQVEVGLETPSSANDVDREDEVGYPHVGSRGRNAHADWYSEAVVGSGNVGVGDLVVLENVTANFEATDDHLGATVALLTGRVMIGNARLPRVFPDLDIRLELAGPDITPRMRGGSEVWDLGYAVEDLNPLGFEFPWNDVRVSVYRTNGTQYELLYGANVSVYDPESDGITGVFYEDAGVADESISEGDGLRFTCLYADFEGALVRLDVENAIVRFHLPTSFEDL